MNFFSRRFCCRRLPSGNGWIRSAASHQEIAIKSGNLFADGPTLVAQGPSLKTVQLIFPLVVYPFSRSVGLLDFYLIMSTSSSTPACNFASRFVVDSKRLSTKNVEERLFSLRDWGRKVERRSFSFLSFFVPWQRKVLKFEDFVFSLLYSRSPEFYVVHISPAWKDIVIHENWVFPFKKIVKLTFFA